MSAAEAHAAETGRPRLGLTAIILTFNEELHLARALSSISGLADEVFVIDSFSTDQTLEIAESHGARVLQHAFVNQAKQFQWALDHAPISGEWVLRLDADEIIEADLADNIRRTLPSLPQDITGINLKRKHIFMGRWIRHGGRYPMTLLRIFRRGMARVEDRWMDEHILIKSGRTITLDGGFADHNLNDLSYFTEKHNRYATREAIEVLNQRYGFLDSGSDSAGRRTSRQAAFKRLVKEHLYNRMPGALAALLYFLFRYVAQFGFLDGREGLVYHVLQGFWYRFLVAAKVMELERAIRPVAHERELVLDEIARLTGLRLQPQAPARHRP